MQLPTAPADIVEYVPSCITRDDLPGDMPEALAGFLLRNEHAPSLSGWHTTTAPDKRPQVEALLAPRPADIAQDDLIRLGQEHHGHLTWDTPDRITLNILTGDGTWLSFWHPTH